MGFMNNIPLRSLMFTVFTIGLFYFGVFPLAPPAGVGVCGSVVSPTLSN